MSELIAPHIPRRTSVADVMTTAVVSVPPSLPVPEVASTLFGAAVRAVPVLDDEGDLLGVISEADLMASVAAIDPVERRWWRPRHVHRGVPAARPGASTAGELMSGALVTIGPDATVAMAARLMREQGVSWLPVLADGRLVGVLGRSDLLVIFLRPDAAIQAEIVQDVLVGTLVTDPDRVAVEVTDGLVTLTGELDTHMDAEVAVARTHGVEGVVDVVDRLTWQVPDRPDTIPVRSLLF
jgi:CBS domain-containing protein